MGLLSAENRRRKAGSRAMRRRPIPAVSGWREALDYYPILLKDGAEFGEANRFSPSVSDGRIHVLLRSKSQREETKGRHPHFLWGNSGRTPANAIFEGYGNPSIY